MESLSAPKAPTVGASFPPFLPWISLYIYLLEILEQAKLISGDRNQRSVVVGMGGLDWNAAGRTYWDDRNVLS